MVPKEIVSKMLIIKNHRDYNWNKNRKNSKERSIKDS